MNEYRAREVEFTINGAVITNKIRERRTFLIFLNKSKRKRCMLDPNVDETMIYLKIILNA